MTSDERRHLEATTRSQAESLKWWEERKKRLTGSNFGQVARMTKKADPKKRPRELFSTNSSPGQLHMDVRWRMWPAPSIRSRLEKNIQRAGLFVGENEPFLDLSTDGLTYFNIPKWDLHCLTSLSLLMFPPESYPVFGHSSKENWVVIGVIAEWPNASRFSPTGLNKSPHTRHGLQLNHHGKVFYVRRLPKARTLFNFGQFPNLIFNSPELKNVEIPKIKISQ